MVVAVIAAFLMEVELRGSGGGVGVFIVSISTCNVKIHAIDIINVGLISFAEGVLVVMHPYL